MITPLRNNNSVGVVGDDDLGDRIVPMIFPRGFKMWRPEMDPTAVNPHRGRVTMPLVASSDVVVVSGTLDETVLGMTFAMSPERTIFVAVVDSEEEPAAQFLKNQSRRPWFIVKFRRSANNAEELEREDRLHSFEQMLPIRDPRLLQHMLAVSLPMLGARIIARSKFPEEEVA